MNSRQAKKCMRRPFIFYRGSTRQRLRRRFPLYFKNVDRFVEAMNKEFWGSPLPDSYFTSEPANADVTPSLQ